MTEEICLDRRSRGIYEAAQASESASMCSRERAGGVQPLLSPAFSFPSQRTRSLPRASPAKLRETARLRDGNVDAGGRLGRH